MKEKKRAAKLLKSADLRYADLRYADLRYADLSGTDLRGVVGNQVEIHSLQLPKYKVVMTKELIYIGCQVHSKEDWLKFDREELKGMDGENGLEWWDNYSKIVFELYDKIIEQLNVASH